MKDFNKEYEIIVGKYNDLVNEVHINITYHKVIDKPNKLFIRLVDKDNNIIKFNSSNLHLYTT